MTIVSAYFLTHWKSVLFVFILLGIIITIAVMLFNAPYISQMVAP